MSSIVNTGLSGLRRTVIMRAGVVSGALLLLCLCAESATAQQQEKRNDLDVTMQIIVDPDAKLPDEVVRRIPLPARKSAESSSAAVGSKSKPEAGTGKERDNAASEHGKETSEAAQERAREAAEQREAARRAEAEERRRDGPPDHPGPPDQPPH